ncbi:hypothetical protein J8L86_12115 [Shewanella sp. MMG014]|uniref:hypothetical protein n=1 Tax=Shewanella sp. MMG014 TaxID=2822691 RepID=UPI001B39C9CC|nr:hypothetical protein [Shewanella sp. MMG014]MBQ4890596.1 hypothetical protein [Shewanella sp. MMG014]
MSPADLYRLALDKHLLMSVKLNANAYVKGGQYITPEDSDSNTFQIEKNLATNEVLDKPYQVCLDDELQVGENSWLVFDKKVQVIDGIWDLAMIGLEYYEIDKLYQKEVGGTVPTLDALNGFFLKRNDHIYKVQRNLQLEGNQYNSTALEANLKQILTANGKSLWDLKLSNNSLELDGLSDDELDDLMALSCALIPYETGEYVESDCYIELKKPSYQIVIKTQELDRFIQSLGGTPKEVAPLTEKVYTKNNYNKAQTQAKYSKWQRQAIKLKKSHPSHSKTWIAAQIAKLPIAEGKSADTIRKNIKI